MRSGIVLLISVLSCTGCQALALKRCTLEQGATPTDIRYQEVLDDLAMVAHDPYALPAYSSIFAGSAVVTDTAQFVSTTTLGTAGAGGQVISPQYSRATLGNWSLDPLNAPEKLEAMRCACRWVLAGPEQAGPNCASILADPEVDLSPGPHFGVMGRLVRLPPGWLHVGLSRDVPKGACYKDHCGGTWVWVMPDGMEGLAGFTLVLQDIATLDVAPADGSVPANLLPPSLVTLWVVQNTLPPLVINIEGTVNGAIVYRSEGEKSQKPVEVVIAGQPVVWRNKDRASHKITMILQATSPIPVLVGDIGAGHDSRQVTFDQDAYNKAGGTANGSLSISIRGDGVDAGTISLKGANQLYSPTLVFRVDRVIRPECRCLIEGKMREGLANNKPVEIPWPDWMAMTTPFQGQRTGVKPGDPTKKPITHPNRLLPQALMPPPGFGTFYGNYAPTTETGPMSKAGDNPDPGPEGIPPGRIAPL